MASPRHSVERATERNAPPLVIGLRSLLQASGRRTTRAKTGESPRNDLRPLIGDDSLGWLALLLGLTAAFLAAAVLAFERRDIGSGTASTRWMRIVRLRRPAQSVTPLSAGPHSDPAPRNG